MKETIKLFPSNWLYNASVIGFLKIMAHGLGEEEVENWLNDDGTFIFKKSLLADSFQYYKSYNTEKGNKEVPLSGKNKFFPNYLQAGDEKDFEIYVSKLTDLSSSGENFCGFCFNSFYFKEKNKLDQRLIKVIDRIASNFSVVHSSFLGPSLNKFPNSFWSLNSSLRICPLCAYFIIFSQIPFFNAKDENIFINSNSFKVTWFLNKYVDAVYSSNSRELFAVGLMELSQKTNKILGMWSTFNIEMVQKTYKGIKYFSLPYETSRILLNRNISSLIRKTKEPFVQNSIISGKYENLIKLCNKLMKSIVSGKPDKNDSFISQLSSKSIAHLKELSSILPELYIKINKLLNQEVM